MGPCAFIFSRRSSDAVPSVLNSTRKSFATDDLRFQPARSNMNSTCPGMSAPRTRGARISGESGARGLVGHAHRTARPLQIFFEQLPSDPGRKCRRSGRAGGAQELLEGAFHRSRLHLPGSVEPFFGCGEAWPSGQRGREVHFAPLRMPLWPVSSDSAPKNAGTNLAIRTFDSSHLAVLLATSTARTETVSMVCPSGISAG